MELKQLQTFKTLAEKLNFTRTAQLLNYAQSSVTAQIQGLEIELGVPLFERLGKRVLLTTAGERLLPYANEILRLADEVQVTVPGDEIPNGTLTIGAIESLTTYRLSPILGEYRRRFPQVELVFRTGICADLRKEVINGRLDLAFTLEDVVRHDQLVFEEMIDETMLILAHPMHKLVQNKEVHATDLDGETILVTEPGCSYRTMLEQTLESTGLKNMKIEFSSIEAIKRCAMVGLGVTLLPKVAVTEELISGKLAVLPWRGVEFPFVTRMVWHKDKWISPALQAFIQIARQELNHQGKPALQNKWIG